MSATACSADRKGAAGRLRLDRPGRPAYPLYPTGTHLLEETSMAMHEHPADDGSAREWLYDETAHAGIDYADPMVAADYDAQHEKFRDYEKDALLLIERLGLAPEHTVVDLGCGTGAFALTAARHCRRVYAVDVSHSMLARLEEKARAAGLDNIETHHAGFLGYRHEDAPADALVCTAALHHLPDFWKAVALHRMAAMLRPGGRMYLFDIVFSFPIAEYRARIDGWLGAMAEKATPAMAREALVHVRDEFSTFDWILEGMLERTGFAIERTYADFPNGISYVCVK